MNNLHVRNTNKKKIINYLYANGKATKHDISKDLGLSMPTVSLIMKDLYNRGLIKKSGTLESSGGRKPVANTFVYDAKISVGIEITQNHIRFAMIDLGANIICHKKLKEPFQNNDIYYKKLADYTELFLNDSKIDKNSLLGIGLAFPGLVYTNENVLAYSPTLGICNFPIKVMTKYIPYPIMSDNEASLAGFAEIWKIDDIESAVFLSINKGVGGAIIINNKLYSGVNGRSAEFGHMTIVKEGLECSCGKRGCLEAYCSTKILTEPNFDDVDDFFLALESQDRYCISKWETYLDYLAVGINNLRTIFDSDIIIGGEIDKYLEKYSDMLYERLQALNTFGDKPNYIHFSKYSEKASAVGAALLLVDSFFNNDTAKNFV